MSEFGREPDFRNFEWPSTATGRLLVELVEDQLRGKELVSIWKADLETDETVINTIRITQGVYVDGQVVRRELEDTDSDIISDFMEAEDNHVFVDIMYKNAPTDSYGSRLNIKLRDDGKACGVLSREGEAQDMFGVVHTQFETMGMAGEPKLPSAALDILQALTMHASMADPKKLSHDEEAVIEYLAEDLLHEVQELDDDSVNAPESQRRAVARALIDYCEFSGQPKIGLSVRHELEDQLLLIECDPLDGGYLQGNARLALTLGHPDGPSHNFVQLRQTYDGEMKYFIRKPAQEETISRTAQESDVAHFLKALMRI